MVSKREGERKKRGKRCTRKREIGKEKKNRIKERPGNDSGIGHGNVQQQCVNKVVKKQPS